MSATEVSILPSGQLALSPRDSAFAPALARGIGHLLLAFAAAPVSESPPFFRDLARDFIAAAARGDLTTPDFSARVKIAPPFLGAEYLSATLLVMYWNALAEAFAQERAATPLDKFIARFGDDFHVPGRVVFHLAENKRDPESPFAFLATYTNGDKHEPLGTALDRYAGAKNKAALSALLAPVQRAAEQSEWLHQMVDAGDVYHPLAWSPEEAYAFLHEVPALEAAGIIVRVPDWWKLRRTPEVSITVGTKAPGDLGYNALLDFDAALTLDGAPLTEAELRAAGDGLVLLKGKWVELDHARLQEVLAHWQGVSEQGVSFAEGMRLLAGAPQSADDSFAPALLQPRAGPWLEKALASFERPREIDPGHAIKATLRPYQKQGVAWLSALTQLGLSALLADDMGLGKTLQVLSLIAVRRQGTHLLVVPASLIGNWLSEIERFAPQLRVQVAHGAFDWSGEIAGDLVITTYGFLQRAAALREHAWDLVVLDEAQAIKNPGAKQTRAVKALTSRARIALTGTPVENRLGDLWSLFDFLAPGLLGTAASFTRFEKKLAEKHDYAPLRALVRPYILRRMKTDKSVIADLPDKTEVTAHCGLSKRQAALYETSVRALEKALQTAEGAERRGLVLAFLMRFKQICNHPSQWLGDGAYAPEDSGKFARLREIAETIVERQEKVLVFSQFREMVKPLHDFLAEIFAQPGLTLAGDTPIAKRKALVAQLQDPAGPPFFVLSLKAGGTGLNLTAASHVVHFDRWWNPAVEDQATDRAFRIGQKRNVLVHKFLTRGTVEEKIDALIASKRGLSQEILAGGSEVPFTEMSNDELMALVRLDLDAVAG